MESEEKITAIINQWDPIHLFPLAPYDEYDYEIKAIVKFLKANTSQEKLATEIYSIFHNEFGDVFDKDLTDCRCIAKKILEDRGTVLSS